MSHPDQLYFLQQCARLTERRAGSPTVVEIGSFDVNGSCRSIFQSAAQYTGIDLAAGPGVDVVASGHEYGASGTFDIVVSAECLEHNPYWLETFLNMVRISKPGGLVIMTCASRGRLEHGTSRTVPAMSPGTSRLGWDYYQNLTEKDFVSRVDLSLHFKSHAFITNRRSCDLYFVGIKSSPSQSAAPVQGEDLPALFGSFLEDLAAAVPFECRWQEKLFMLPVRVAARVLPERRFQSFAFGYLSWWRSLRGGTQ